MLEVCIEYKVEFEYCRIDSEFVRNKFGQTQEKLVQQYPKRSNAGFPNSGNAEQTLTVKRIGGKLKTIRTNFKKAVDTIIRSGGGRVVLTFSGLYQKFWSGSPTVTSIENSIDTSSSTNQSPESTKNNNKNMAPSSAEGT